MTKLIRTKTGLEYYDTGMVYVRQLRYPGKPNKVPVPPKADNDE